MAIEAHNALRPSRRRLSAAAVIALVLCAGASPAAQAKIILDPEGPAAKQYSALLDRARAEGSGSQGTAGVPGSTVEAPPFGQGIDNARGGGAPGGGTERGQPSVSLGPSGEGSAFLGVAIIALAVLALGALLGFGAREVASRQSA
jgi:hypothetical protein